MNKKIIFFGIAILAIIIFAAAGLWLWGNYQNSGKYDSFAQCIKNSGAVFYGAFWCPHCQNQKKAFGNSEKYLPYVECSTQDGNSQTQICKDKKIESYPTWEFKSGDRQEGEMTLQELADKTKCNLPK